jgi:hypothetical protein
LKQAESTCLAEVRTGQSAQSTDRRSWMRSHSSQWRPASWRENTYSRNQHQICWISQKVSTVTEHSYYSYRTLELIASLSADNLSLLIQSSFYPVLASKRLILSWKTFVT